MASEWTLPAQRRMRWPRALGIIGLVAALTAGSIRAYDHRRCERLAREMPSTAAGFDAWARARPYAGLDDLDELCRCTVSGTVAPTTLVRITPFVDGGQALTVGEGLLAALATRPDTVLVALEGADERSRRAALGLLAFTYGDTGGEETHPHLRKTLEAAAHRLAASQGHAAERHWQRLIRWLPGHD